MKSVCLRVVLALSLIIGVSVYEFRSRVDIPEVGGDVDGKKTAVGRVHEVTPRMVDSERVREGVRSRGWQGASAEDDLLREEWRKQDEELLATLSAELGLSGAQVAELETFFKDRRFWANGYDREGVLMEDKRSLDSVLKDMLDEEQMVRLKLRRERQVAAITENNLKARREGLRRAVEMTDAEAEQVETILKDAVIEHYALMDEIGIHSMKYGDYMRHNALKTVAEVDGENGKIYVEPTGELGEKLMSSISIEKAPYGADLIQATLLKLSGVLGRERTMEYQQFIRYPNGVPKRVDSGQSDTALEAE